MRPPFARDDGQGSPFALRGRPARRGGWAIRWGSGHRWPSLALDLTELADCRVSANPLVLYPSIGSLTRTNHCVPTGTIGPLTLALSPIGPLYETAFPTLRLEALVTGCWLWPIGAAQLVRFRVEWLINRVEWLIK